MFETRAKPAGASTRHPGSVIQARGLSLRRGSFRLLPSAVCAAAALMTLLGGCVPIEGTIPAPTKAVPSGGFRAGASRVDITPPPGLPLGGHSVNGRVAEGAWLKLGARAVYLEDAQGSGVVVAVAELWGMPAGLVDRVAELLSTASELQAKTGGRRLSRDQIILSATHTHHGPTGFATTPAGATLLGPLRGFDRRVFEFLAWRIAWAAADAIEHSEPATIARAAQPLGSTFRNRSMDPFDANPEAASLIRANQDQGLPPCRRLAEYPREDACHAVDPLVTVLRIDRSGEDKSREDKNGPIALLAFAASHPTAISNHTALYAGDFFGVAASKVEQRLKADHGSATVVAIVNGAQGDVSPAWERQQRSEVLRLGGQLGDAILQASKSATGKLEGPVAFRTDLVDQKGGELEGDGGSRTASFAMAGRATICGAEDGRSTTAAWISHEGLRGVDLGPHGTKIGALDLIEAFGVVVPPFWFTRLALAILPLERHLPISVVSIGDLYLATLPGEFTTMLGRRIRTGIAKASSTKFDDTLLVGVSQAYGYYFTTPEEYDLQNYEGSGMLWGRQAGALVGERIVKLAAKAGQANHADSAQSYSHRSIGAVEFPVGRSGVDPREMGTGREDILRHSPSDASRAIVGPYCWNEPASELDTSNQDPPKPVVPSVRIERALNEASGPTWSPYRVDGIEESDRGSNFVTTGDLTEPGQMRWCTRWLPQQGVDLSGRYRFAITTTEGEIIESPERQISQ